MLVEKANEYLVKALQLIDETKMQEATTILSTFADTINVQDLFDNYNSNTDAVTLVCIHKSIENREIEAYSRSWGIIEYALHINPNNDVIKDIYLENLAFYDYYNDKLNKDSEFDQDVVDYISSVITNSRNNIKILTLGLLRLYFYDDYLFESYKFNNRVRSIFRSKMVEHFAQTKIIPKDKNVQTHELISPLKNEYFRIIDRLESIIKDIEQSMDFESIDSSRNILVRELKSLSLFLLPCEYVVDKFTDVIIIQFSAYTKERSQVNMNNLIDKVSSLKREMEETGSWVIRNLLFKLCNFIINLIPVDFDNKSIQTKSILNIVLNKPVFPLIKDSKSTIKGYFENLGDGQISNFGIMLNLSTPEAELCSESEICISDTLEPGSKKPFSFSLIVLNQVRKIAVEYLLYWDNAIGTQETKSGLLEIEAQKEVLHDIIPEIPYSLTSVREKSKLKGRDTYLKKLQGGVTNSTSFYITGQKRVGKTSIALVFYNEVSKKSNVLPVYITWGDLGGLQPNDIGKELCRLAALYFTRDLKRTFDIEHIAKNDIPTFAGVMKEFLDELNYSYPNYKVVIIIDDFDEIPSNLYTGNVGDNFFLGLRSCINRGNISFVLIGSEKLPLILKHQGEKLNQVRSLEVDYLSQEDLEKLITEPSKGYLEYNSEAISEIFYWSGGNPFYATLICIKLWEYMIERKDYYVSAFDVDDIVLEIAKTEQESVFKHFWTDAISVDGYEFQRISRENAELLMHVGALSDKIDDFVHFNKIAEMLRDISDNDLRYRLSELVERKVLMTDPDRASFKIKVRLFNLWLLNGGITKILRGLGDPIVQRKATKIITDDEIIDVADGLLYCGEKVNEIKIRKWLSQFGDDYNKRLMFKLLNHLKINGYFGSEKLTTSYLNIYKKITSMVVQSLSNKNKVSNFFVIQIDDVGKSGGSVIYSFRTTNKIPYSNVGSLDKLSQLIKDRIQKTTVALIAINDFIGSGGSAIAEINATIKKLDIIIPEWKEKIKFFYCAACGINNGINEIEDEFGDSIIVIVDKIITDSDKAFDPNNNVFDTPRERADAEHLCKSIGGQLEPKHPLGFKDSQALVCFEHTIPNNTLPIFYKNNKKYDGKDWYALFSRT